MSYHEILEKKIELAKKIIDDRPLLIRKKRKKQYYSDFKNDNREYMIPAKYHVKSIHYLNP